MKLFIIHNLIQLAAEIWRRAVRMSDQHHSGNEPPCVLNSSGEPSDMKFSLSSETISAEPYTVILGGQDIFLEEGFTMNLTCLVRDSPEPPQYIFWYHNQQVNDINKNKCQIVFLRSRYHIHQKEEASVKSLKKATQQHHFCWYKKLSWQTLGHMHVMPLLGPYHKSWFMSLEVSWYALIYCTIWM